MNIFSKGRVKLISQQSINNFSRKLWEWKGRIIHNLKTHKNTQNRMQIEATYERNKISIEILDSGPAPKEDSYINCW